MKEYIEREAAINAVLEAYADGRSAYIALVAIPAADVVARDCYDRLLAENDELRKERPVVRCGEWVEENTRPRSSQFYCSVCHRTAYDPQPTRSVGWVKRCRYHYCPNCGALMDKDGDGNG